LKFFEKFLAAFSLLLGFTTITALFLFLATLADQGYFGFVGESVSQTEAAARPGRPLRQLVGSRFLFQERVVEIVLFWWVFFFGSAIGSFLNVVVWRMPRGKTIVWKGSFCPRCRADIRFRDNIPIAGWWMLRGKCRKCRLPIPVRYPLVEFITGLMVFGLFLTTTQADGWVYPISDFQKSGWHFWLLDRFFGMMVVLPLFHTFLLSVFITAWWIRVDGTKFPWQLFFISLGFGLFYPLAISLSVPLWDSFGVRLVPPGQSMAFFPEQIVFGSSSVPAEARVFLCQAIFGFTGALLGTVVTSCLKMAKKDLFSNNDCSIEKISKEEESEEVLGDDICGPPGHWELTLFYILVGVYGGGGLLLSFLLTHVIFTGLLGFCFPPNHRLSGRAAWLALPFALLGAIAFWRLSWSVLSTLF